uniref:Uncharacterized protein n=1 Tax=Rhizophagus irregularis (strain DAOM 181602 / DAOM 197198 / MUCL 43194) TaxID=747089 RepID=U9SK82_RHIID
MTKFIFYKLENKQSVKICYFPKFTTGKRLDYDATSFKAQSLLFFQIFQRLAQHEDMLTENHYNAYQTLVLSFELPRKLRLTHLVYFLRLLKLITDAHKSLKTNLTLIKIQVNFTSGER